MQWRGTTQFPASIIWIDGVTINITSAPASLRRLDSGDPEKITGQKFPKSIFKSVHSCCPFSLKLSTTLRRSSHNKGLPARGKYDNHNRVTLPNSKKTTNCYNLRHERNKARCKKGGEPSRVSQGVGSKSRKGLELDQPRSSSTG